LSRTQAASVGVIGVAAKNRTGDIGSGRSRSSMTLEPNRNAVKGAPSNSGAPKSTSASPSRIRPSTAGAAASTATDLANPVGVGARSETTTSARGPSWESAMNSVGSIIA
jgi:hypothetical protein